MAATADIMKMIKDNDVKFVDVQFGDLFGTLHHFTIPAVSIDEDALRRRLPLRRFVDPRLEVDRQVGHELKPDPDSAYIDPFREQATLCMLGDVSSPAPVSSTTAAPARSSRRPWPT